MRNARILLPFALLLAAGAQESTEDALARKCDSEIPWITDGAILPENEWTRRILRYEHDRDPQLEEALEKARQRKRLILWFCPRVPGAHMYRAKALEDYCKIVLFTDPGIVDLVRAKFIPLRMCCDENLGARLGIRRFEFVEPGLVLLTPEGKVVHVLDRIRTFNACWLRAALVAILRRHPEYNAPAGESAEDLIRGGDDERALPLASPEQKALIWRRSARFAEVHALPGVAGQKALALLNEGRLDEAARALEGEPTAEALYHLAIADYWSGRSPERRLREVIRRDPASRWAWRAAANLKRGTDGFPSGPLPRGFEDVFHAPDPGPATATRALAKDVDAAVRRAVAFLLRSQREDGSWNDARFPFSADAKQLLHYFLAVTASAALALSEWRAVDPERIDVALRCAEGWMFDESRMNRGHDHECYADAYRLLYAASRKNLRQMNALVRHLSLQQHESGFWAHSYANTFTTAAVVHCLIEARKAGADVPDAMLQRAAGALEPKRGPGGRFAYNAERGPSSEKDSMARKALCELALYECGRSTPEAVEAGIESYWKFLPRLEAVRACDFHADGELGGFTFFHGAFFTCEAARVLGGAARPAHAERFRRQMLSIPELDGSFLDSHDLGKSYATAHALLILSRSR